MADSGRKLRFYQAGTAIAATTTDNVQNNASAVDITNKDSSGYRLILDDAGVVSMTGTLAGYFESGSNNAGIRDDILNNIDLMLTDITLVWPDGNIASGNVFLSSYSNVANHDGAVEFDATFEFSGEYVLAPPSFFVRGQYTVSNPTPTGEEITWSLQSSSTQKAATNAIIQPSGAYLFEVATISGFGSSQDIGISDIDPLNEGVDYVSTANSISIRPFQGIIRRELDVDGFEDNFDPPQMGTSGMLFYVDFDAKIASWYDQAGVLTGSVTWTQTLTNNFYIFMQRGSSANGYIFRLKQDQFTISTANVPAGWVAPGDL
jgi:predicted secreted protein